jgi:hypothetical protein
MNRRDALKAAVVGIAGVSGADIELVDVQKPFIAVLRIPGRISDGVRTSIRDSWKMVTAESGWPDLRLVLLENGMELEIIEDPRGDA